MLTFGPARLPPSAGTSHANYLISKDIANSKLVVIVEGLDGHAMERATLPGTDKDAHNTPGPRKSSGCPLQKSGYHKYHQAIERLKRNLKNTFSSIYRFKGARVKVSQDIVQRRLIYQTACEQKRVIPCYADRLNLVLHESGDIYPGEMLNESFGNIKQCGYDVGRVMRSEKALKIIDIIRANQCYFTHECYSMTNILFNPKLYPALAKEYLHVTR